MGGVSKEVRASGALAWSAIRSYLTMGGSGLSRFFVVLVMMGAVVSQVNLRSHSRACL